MSVDPAPKTDSRIWKADGQCGAGVPGRARHPGRLLQWMRAFYPAHPAEQARISIVVVG